MADHARTDIDETLRSRKKDFKKTFDVDEARRKREDEEVLMRKTERAMLLAKKRQFTGNGPANFAGGGGDGNLNDFPSSSSTAMPNGGGNNMMSNGNGGIPMTSNVDRETQQILNSAPSLNQALLSDKVSDQDAIPQLANILQNPNSGPEELHAAVFGLRKRLSKEDDPPINLVVQAGLTSRLVQLMMATEDHKTKFECAWALTNIGSGNSEQTAAVVNTGGIDAFIGILESTWALKHDLCEQCIWALGNIAGDGCDLRDKLLNKGLMSKCQNICSAMAELGWDDQQKVTLMRNLIWVMSNLCRGKPSPKFETVKPAFAVFAEVVGRNEDEEQVMDALWGLSYLVGGSDNEGEDDLRCAGLIVSGQPDQSEIKVEPNLLCQFIIRFIENKPEKPAQEVLNYKQSKRDAEHRFRAPALRIVGNMVSANDHRIADILLLSGLHQPLVNILRWCTRENMRREAAWTLSNLAAGVPAQVVKLGNVVGNYEAEVTENGQTVMRQFPLDTFDILTACVLGSNYNSTAEELIIHPVMQQQVKKECSYALLNAVNVNWGDDSADLERLIPALVENKQFMQVLLEVFRFEDHRMITDAVTALNTTLQFCQMKTDQQNQGQNVTSTMAVNVYAQMAEEVGLKDALLNVCDKFYKSNAYKSNRNSRTLDECERLLETWFKNGDEEDLCDFDNGTGDYNFGEGLGDGPAGGFNFS